MTLSARASTLGGILSILKFWIFDGSTLLNTGFGFRNRLTPHALPLTELLDPLSPARSAEL
jgi:hypothetical protein